MTQEQEQAQPQTQPQAKLKKKSWVKISFTVFLWMLIAAMAFSIVCFIRFEIIYTPFEVKMDSMQTTLKPGDIVYVNTKAAKRPGDIIVIDRGKTVPKDDRYIIKRLIAVGGETIDIRETGAEEYEVFINGEPLDEPYIKDYPNKATMKAKGEQWTAPITLEDDEIFAMGDNRMNSTDSVDWGPFKASMVVGHVDYKTDAKKTTMTARFERFKFIFMWR